MAPTGASSRNILSDLLTGLDKKSKPMLAINASNMGISSVNDGYQHETVHGSSPRLRGQESTFKQVTASVNYSDQ